MLTVLAAALYAWGLSRGAPHYYYSAAMRSMSESWHAFFFGAFDPSGFVTTDKLPGSLWVHALFVRVFGTQSWVFLLPEVLAASASVPLLFGAVRRWAGARAGFAAAVIFLCTPVVFATAQVNIPDTLLMCAVVAAAYALVRALEHPGWRWLVLSAVLVGVGFQVKMLQALLVLPAFCLTYLFFAAAAPRVRLVRAVVYGALSVLVSLSWMTVVSLVPAGARPQVDGSASNSLWDMVFVYNGVSRGGQGGVAGLFGGEPGATRLVNEQSGGQIGWLLPLAVVLLVAGLLRARTRSDRAGWLLWGGWLVLGGAVLSLLGGMHPYYTAILAPAVAAVAGTGLVRAFADWRARRPAGWLLPAGVLLTAGWALVLLTRQRAGLGWLPPLIAVAAVLAVGLLLVLRVSRDGRRAIAMAAVFTAAVALFAGPATWLVSTPRIDGHSTRVVDPVAGPPQVQAAGARRSGGTLPVVNQDLLDYLLAHHGKERFLFAAGESSTAAPYLGDGRNVLPLRGFTENSPSIPVDELSRLVAAGELRYVLMINLPGMTGQALQRADWIHAHCATVPRPAYQPTAVPGRWDPTLYDCVPGAHPSPAS